MDVVVSSAGVPGSYAPRVPSPTQVSVIQVTLNADVTLLPVNLKPGEYARVRITQNATGGHGVTWTSPPTIDGTLPTVDPTANASTEIYFLVRTTSAIEVQSTGGGPTPGNPTQLFVANWAALLALDTTGFVSGTVAFVETLKDFAMLDRDSAATVVDLMVGDATVGGQWLRLLKPDPFWVYQPTFFVDPANGAASDENDGLSSGSPLATLEEWKRRVQQPWPPIGNAMTVELLSAYTDPFSFDASCFGASPNSATIDGTTNATKIITNASIAHVTVASATGANGTDGTLGLAATTWTSSVGHIGIVNAGARAGARFGVYKDQGVVGGLQTARVGNVSAGDFDPTPATLQAGDTFDTWQWVHLTGDITIENFGGDGLNFQSLQLGNVSTAANAVVATDACVGTSFSNSGCDDNELFCSIFTTVEAFLDGIVYLQGGGSLGGRISSNDSSLIWYGYYTLQNSVMNFNEGRGVKATLINGPTPPWVASFDCTSPALTITQGCLFRTAGGGPFWGSGNTAPFIELVGPGALFAYDPGSPPKVTGSGSPDISIEGNSVLYAALPVVIGTSAVGDNATTPLTGDVAPTPNTLLLRGGDGHGELTALDVDTITSTVSHFLTLGANFFIGFSDGTTRYARISEPSGGQVALAPDGSTTIMLIGGTLAELALQANSAGGIMPLQVGGHTILQVGTPSQADVINMLDTTGSARVHWNGVDQSVSTLGAARFSSAVGILARTGAQTVPLNQSNIYEVQNGGTISSLTGDTAVTWSKIAAFDLLTSDQEWTVEYQPNGHHMTFPNSQFPTVPSTLNAAAFAAAETTLGAAPATMTVSFVSDTSGRIQIKGWAGAP